MKRLAIAALLAGALLAGAGAPAHESPPPLGQPLPFVLPAEQRIALPNGLAVTLVPFGTVPKLTILVTMRTGSIADGDKNGLADLVTALMKEGAGSRDAEGVARAAAEMGGALEIGAGPDQLSVSMDVLAERAADAIQLIADALRRPRLPAQELPRLKTDMARQMAIARSQPQAIAGEAFAHLVWGDSVYGRMLPTDAQIAAIGIDDAKQFVATEFGAARTHVYVAGRFDSAAIEAALRAAFGDWAAGPAPRHGAPAGSRARVVRLIDRPGAPQSTILMGLPVPPPASPGFMRLSLANALLGGSLLSRLNQNLREDKGYTYGASSHISPYQGVAGWSLATDVNAPQTAAALGEIFRELARLRSESPPADELRMIQNYRAGTFVLGASSRPGLLAQLAFLDQQGLPEGWLTHYVENLYAVTPDEVRAAAAEALGPDAMTIVIVGDLAKIKASILALEPLHGAEIR
jgi:predicted Zn-dependent peptidase